MILHPAVLALLLIALLVAGIGLYAGYYGIKIICRWNPASGSEQQLELERRTYLLSTLMACVLGFEIISLFLFIFTADDMHSLFTGAMCAAGTLATNSFGYPALTIKMVVSAVAGVWLIINHVDNRGFDYPLIKVKYRLLVAVVPFLVLELWLLSAFFYGMSPEIITSCCGSQFSRESGGLGKNLAALPYLPTLTAFFSGMALTVVSGLLSWLKGRAGYLFPVAAVVTFFIAAASVVSFICLYIYELPTHHCPFCILHKEYGYIGFVLYSALYCGAVAGFGAGVLSPSRHIVSLHRVIPSVQRRLIIITLVSYMLFTLVTTWKMISSALKLQ